MPARTYIAIEGPIGVGKTTLARMLQPDLGAELLLEIFEENPFLSAFYADRERFAFQTQIVFLLSRYRQQRAVQRIVQRQSLISDYIFAKDRLFAHLNLHGDELETYERLHSALAERIVNPDLVLYLRASPEVLMERIATRDRPYERSMSADYIMALARAYDEFFAGYHDTRVEIIDYDRLNVVRSPQDLRSVADRIRAALAGAPAPTARSAASTWAEGRQSGRGAAAQRGEEALAFLELYQESLSFQRAAGELAGALLQSWTRQLAASEGEPAPGPGEAEEESPTLGEALAACERSLGRMLEMSKRADEARRLSGLLRSSE